MKSCPRDASGDNTKGQLRDCNCPFVCLNVVISISERIEVLGIHASLFNQHQGYRQHRNRKAKNHDHAGEDRSQIYRDAKKSPMVGRFRFSGISMRL